MKKLNNAIRNSFDSTIRKARETLSNQRGDFYISDAVKIIIAVVLGAEQGTALYVNGVVPVASGCFQKLIHFIGHKNIPLIFITLFLKEKSAIDPEECCIILNKHTFEAAYAQYVEWHTASPESCSLKQLCEATAHGPAVFPVGAYIGIAGGPVGA